LLTVGNISQHICTVSDSGKTMLLGFGVMHKNNHVGQENIHWDSWASQ